MPGYFSYPFADDEATGFFGGYRRPQSASADPNVVPVGDMAPSAASPDVLRYPNGTPVMDFNTGRPFPRPDRLDMQNNIATGQALKQLAEAPPSGLADPNVMFGFCFLTGL